MRDYIHSKNDAEYPKKKGVPVRQTGVVRTKGRGPNEKVWGRTKCTTCALALNGAHVKKMKIILVQTKPNQAVVFEPEPCHTFRQRDTFSPTFHLPATPQTVLS